MLKGPNGPAAFLVRFAESGIDLELGVWINDPENGQLNLRSALNQRILRAFRANGIQMPYPQRDVRIVGAPGGTALARPNRLRRKPVPDGSRAAVVRKSLCHRNKLQVSRIFNRFRV